MRLKIASNVPSTSAVAVQRRARSGAPSRRASTSLRIGPWRGLADVENDIRAAGDLDRLGPDPERDRLLAEDVAVGVLRVDGLDEEVLDVRVGVRRAPGDPGVVAEDDAGHARERDAGDVVRAVSVTVRQWRPFMNQTDGIAIPRCGSFARSAPPDSLFAGAMTQSFEPTW